MVKELKKVFSLALAFILLLNTYAFVHADELNLSGQASLLIDYDSGIVLFEKNPHEKLYPASTTKILTGILAIENSNMDDIVTIDPEIISLTAGSHIALDYDEEMTVENLLHALLIQSANDAALALGKHVAGSVDGFVKMMNDKAKELGAVDTNFVNPNGLHDEQHVSSAHDLAIFAKYAMENETFREITGKSSFTIPPTNKKTEPRYLYSTNKFLYGNEKINLDGQTIPIKYEGVSGVKTGYTGNAQNCLVTFAEKNNQKLLAVVLKSDGKEVYTDTHKLLNYGFNNFSNTFIGHANEFIDNVSIDNGHLPLVSAILKENVSYPLHSNSLDRIEKKINIDKELKAPINKGDNLGKVEYYLDGNLIGEGDIVSTFAVEALPPTNLIRKILDKWYLFVFAFIIIIRFGYIMNKSKRKRNRRRSKSFRYSHNIR